MGVKIKRDIYTGRTHKEIVAPSLRRTKEPLLERLNYCRAYLSIMGYLTAKESTNILKRLTEQGLE